MIIVCSDYCYVMIVQIAVFLAAVNSVKLWRQCPCSCCCYYCRCLTEMSVERFPFSERLQPPIETAAVAGTVPNLSIACLEPHLYFLRVCHQHWWGHNDVTKNLQIALLGKILPTVQRGQGLRFSLSLLTIVLVLVAIYSWKQTPPSPLVALADSDAYP